ncbi:DddA-like double-stranded DNA deaminase toxin [Streptomyces massasporeus]|uniref:DddA-like double-stranded DNA deaminase toxin n=1 Tax=Streptomyces massasporeus TaxID=67324 RepID=UPI0033D2C1D8
MRLVSGNERADAELKDSVNDRHRKAGFLRGAAKSARASDVEQKMAATMIRDGVDEAELVIDNPAGPCTQPLGCHRVLDAILGKRQLTVHWPNGKGGWENWTYGGAK